MYKKWTKLVIVTVMLLILNSCDSYQAYQDYKIRGIISDKIASINKERMSIHEYYLRNQAFPKDDSFSKKFIEKKDFGYNSSNGQITIIISENDPEEINGLIGEKLIYTPRFNENTYLMTWTCKTTINTSLAPYCQ